MRIALKPGWKSWGLLLVLLAAQHGAVVHELSHLPGSSRAEVRVQGGEAAEACALCPAYAQVATPAFSQAFHVPLLIRAGLQSSPEPADAAVDAAIPSPRSRGPPALT